MKVTIDTGICQECYSAIDRVEYMKDGSGMPTLPSPARRMLRINEDKVVSVLLEGETAEAESLAEITVSESCHTCKYLGPNNVGYIFRTCCALKRNVEVWQKCQRYERATEYKH